MEIDLLLALCVTKKRKVSHWYRDHTTHCDVTSLQDGQRTTGDLSGDTSRPAAMGDLDLERSLAGDLDRDLLRAGEAERSRDGDLSAS